MIQKLQLGGGLFVDSVGSIVRSQQQPVQQTQSSDTGILSDKLLSDLRAKAIPVDMDAFMNQVTKLEQDLQYGFADKRAIRKLEATANRMVQQYDYLKQAEERAVNNDALGEVAVGDRGQLFVLNDKGEINQVSSSEYNYEKNGPALTINELIEHRKFNPTQTFDTSLTQTIRNNLGMSKINQYLLNIIKSVGEASTTSEAYTDLASYIGQEAAKRPTEEQLASLQRMSQLISQLGPDAIFKVKNTQEGKNLDAAFQYIQSVLPRNMRLQLMGRNVAAGNSPESGNQYIQSLIAGALTTSNSTKNESYISYDVSMNKALGVETEKHQTTMTGLEQLIQGTLGKREYQIVSKNNSGLQLSLSGAGLGKLTDAQNKLVNESILSDALNRGLGALIDQNNIFFGDDKISPHMLDKFVYDGADVVNIWAPVGVDGNVDFGKLQKYEELRQKVKNNPQLTQQDIQQLMAEIGIYGTLDSNGDFVGQDPNMAQFIVMTGLTSDEVIDNDQNEFSYKLPKKDKDLALEKIKQIYALSNKGLKKDARREFPTGWFDFSTDIIAAPIFMRVGTTARFDAGTIVGNGARITQQPYSALIANDQARPINKPSSSIL